MTIVNTKNTEHYKWGIDSDGWHLLRSDSLSVIEENVPPGEKEQRHYHNNSQQFFYILSGVAEIDISGTLFRVEAGNGIHVPAKEPHLLANNGAIDLRFLVISEPQSHGDRVVV
jgi:mannose-6-phosphate isomerase-like protein (cupin superfamily)